MIPPEQLLTKRWWEMSAAIPVLPDKSALWQSLLSEILSAYADASRHYHGLAHIAALLELSAANSANLTDPTAVDLAIFYHDAIYSTHRPDNEEQSATLAADRLATAGLAPPMIAKVEHYVRATKHGASPPPGQDPDLDHLLDFDLSILAAPPPDYDGYATAIRREYMAIPEPLYRTGRQKVLRKFLEMPAIYRVPRLAAAWEQDARVNLERELNTLMQP